MGQGPLAGFRIIDLSRVLSGPIATGLLADQGADVIKVEPLVGDVTRFGGEVSGMFVAANRGKRSIAVDLHAPEGIAIVKRLVEDADVFVQNFRPGAADGMGLGADVVRGINPRIVYASISGFGETGPYAHKRVYDPVIQALSGLADLQAANEHDRPRLVRTVIPDKTTGLTVAQAITAALLARERTGEGQHVRVAMLDAVIAFLWPEGLVGLTIVGNEHKVKTGQRARDLIFETQDGYITAGAVSDREWVALCQALDRPQWADDERFRTTWARARNVGLRLEMTAEVIAGDTTAAWLERFDAEAVPCAPVLTRPEVIEQEQVKVNDLIHEFDQPGLGHIRQARPAALFDATPAHLPGREAPRLGAQTREVLEKIGYAAAAIDDLLAKGLVAEPSQGPATP